MKLVKQGKYVSHPMDAAEFLKEFGQWVDATFGVARLKFLVCKKRKWGQPDEREVIRHIKK